jgi:DNA-binding NtrC family response regulator
MKNRSKEPIFVVDDDQGILESFDVMLGDDYHLFMMDNGTGALELIIDHNPRLLFLDIKIPGHDGLDVLQKIREKGIATNVFAVTALAQDYYQEIAEQYGIYRYLHKPLDVDEVQEITRRILH